MEMIEMKELDCVEIIVEKEIYAQEGVHRGMQGWICFDECSDGYWLVNFPQYGAKNDIATLSIKEDDMKIIYKMDARVNEKIKAQNDSKSFAPPSDDLSSYLI